MSKSLRILDDKMIAASSLLQGQQRKASINMYKQDRLKVSRQLQQEADFTQQELTNNPELKNDQKWVMKRILLGDQSETIRMLYESHFINMKPEEMQELMNKVVLEEKAKIQWASIRKSIEYTPNV